jgi:hypothetical protein
MPPILVNANNDPKNKIYVATKAGSASADVEQKIVVDIISKNAGFRIIKWPMQKAIRSS